MKTLSLKTDENRSCLKLNSIETMLMSRNNIKVNYIQTNAVTGQYNCYQASGNDYFDVVDKEKTGQFLPLSNGFLVFNPIFGAFHFIWILIKFHLKPHFENLHPPRLLLQLEMISFFLHRKHCFKKKWYYFAEKKTKMNEIWIFPANGIQKNDMHIRQALPAN